MIMLVQYSRWLKQKRKRGNMLRSIGLPFLVGFCALAIGATAAVPTYASSSQDGIQAPVRAKKPKLFGSREIRSRTAKSFVKWSKMWRRYNLSASTEEQLSQRATVLPRNCLNKSARDCGREAWDAFIEAKKGLPLGELLKEVNLYMNRSAYIVDPVNWGVPDYWATPDEFFLRDGDCEDYAISKYVTLKRLGVDISEMRLVILQDENLRAAHAVLAVKYQDKYMILDNQVNAVLPDTQILHYRPVYSINEGGWWLHHRKQFSGS